MESVFKVEFQAKDKSIEQVDLTISVMLITTDGIAKNFFNGMDPANLYKDNNARAKLERFLRQIVRFNVYVDAIVHKVELEGK
mmetsp:Transcript_1554/g.1059  ORF Transcript_1554/g.1059 Transcript_1554/m.1059 type:complete len:83 (+) Transcript_1554:210-458(+)